MGSAGTTLFNFDNTFVRDLPGLYEPWQAAPASAPRLLAFNTDLAAELGVDADALQGPKGVAVLVGNAIADGASPVAQAYAGHQFGSYSPRLGDGRALLLGEILDASGHRRDLSLKGSGRTPFARGGDGRAAVGPMLREYLISEAMHALAIPTTRSLAVTATGDEITRETMLPGAVLARVAASHIRVGTFEYAARSAFRPRITRKVSKPPSTPATTQRMMLGTLSPEITNPTARPTNTGTAKPRAIHQTAVGSYRLVILKTWYICFRRPGSFADLGVVFFSRAMASTIPALLLHVDGLVPHCTLW